VVALGAVHLQMQQPGRVVVLEELGAAGDVAQRVLTLDGLADDVERAHLATARIDSMMLS
jgi:hypothetical protein